jgi:Spo0E like sporulation regulatory protein
VNRQSLLEQGENKAMNMSNEQPIIKEISFLKDKMIDSGLSKGLSHPETVSFSEKLDKLILKVQDTDMKIDLNNSRI